MNQLLIAVLALALAQCAYAEVWKCTKPDGKVEFSDRPCASGGAKIIVQPNTVSGSATNAETAQKNAELSRRIEERNQQREADRMGAAQFAAQCQQRYDTIARARPFLRAREAADRAAALTEIKLQTRDLLDMGCAAP